MRLFNRHVSTRSLTVFAAEAFLIFGSVALAAGFQNTPDLGANLWKIALVTVVCQLCLYYNDFYDLTLVHATRELVVRLLQAVGAASIVLAAMYFTVPSLMIGDGIFVSALAVFVVGILGWRLLFNYLLGSLKMEERILVVGTGESARKVVRQILDQREFAYRVIGFIDDDASRIGERIVNPGIVGTPADIAALIATHQIDRIVVGLSDRRGKLPIEELLRAKMAGIRVEDAITTYERVTGKILIDGLRPSWLIFSDGFHVSRMTRWLKRSIDLGLSLVLAVLASPLMLLTAIAILIESGRPVFYCQERVGENGKVFTLCKFRSMRQDAEKSGTPIWATDGDNRITRVGRFIRKTRLDELPQIWNVLVGAMSFVGPRPERPYFVAELAKEIPFYQQRHAVKPGVTGWAQVKYRYGASLEDAMEKLRYDLYYIKHLSVFFDLTIVFDTVKVVLFREGGGVTADGEGTWAPGRERQIVTVARNVSTRYLAILAETVVGLVMLPFNLAHLGPTDYGLWVLLGSITVHFSVLDLGYAGALVKFMAQYRAHRNAQALNEIASTLFFVFAGMGLVAYAAAAGVAFNLDHLFKITPAQAETGKWILLIIAVHVALNFPFSVYGGVISGFQRYDANNMVAIVTSIAVAAVNAAVLLAGYGLVALVAATTCVRVAAYFVYRMNAYRIFPDLRIRPSLFRRGRLREVTGFSVYSSIIDWANKLNYQLDELVIGAFMGPAAVAVWAPAERIISGTQRLTNQLNGVLFPVIVDSDASQQKARLQQILLQGTRLSLAMVVPIAAALILLADPLIHAWLGERAAAMAGAIPIIQILAFAVAIRVGNATGTTLLKGAGEHRMLAFVNLATGVANVVLSIALIRRFGLVGVAAGTLIPIALSAFFIVYPAACRRVGLPLSRAIAHSVLPALWPALVVGLALAVTRLISSGTLLAVVLQALGGGVLYLALFFVVAIGREDRTLYAAKIMELLGRRRLASAA